MKMFQKIKGVFNPGLAIFLVVFAFLAGDGCSKKSAQPGPTGEIGLKSEASPPKALVKGTTPSLQEKSPPPAAATSALVKKEEVPPPLLNTVSPPAKGVLSANPSGPTAENYAYNSDGNSRDGSPSYRGLVGSNPLSGANPPSQAPEGSRFGSDPGSFNPSPVFLSNRFNSSASSGDSGSASNDSSAVPFNAPQNSNRPILPLPGVKADLPPAQPLVLRTDRPSGEGSGDGAAGGNGGSGKKGSGEGEGGGKKNTGGSNTDSGKGSGGGTGGGGSGTGGGAGGGGSGSGGGGAGTGGSSGGGSGLGSLSSSAVVAGLQGGGILPSVPLDIPTLDAPVYYRLAFLGEGPLKDIDQVIFPTNTVDTLKKFPDALIGKLSQLDEHTGEYLPIKSGRVRVVYFSKVPDGLNIAKFADANKLFSPLVWGVNKDPVNWQQKGFSLSPQYWDVDFDASAQAVINQNLKFDRIDISHKKGLFLILIYAPAPPVEGNVSTAQALPNSNPCASLAEKAPASDGSIQVAGASEFECMLKSYEFARAMAFYDPPPPAHP